MSERKARTRRLLQRAAHRFWDGHIMALIGVAWIALALILAIGIWAVNRSFGIKDAPLDWQQALASVFAAVTGFAVTAALCINARRQDLAERVEARTSSGQFPVHFREGTGLLASTDQIERLAGVYVLTSLAVEHPLRAHLCVEVLCGYLRMERTTDAPASADPPDPPSATPEGCSGQENRPFAGDIEVRRTVLRELSRLTRGVNGGPGILSEFTLDLSRASLTDVNFSQSVIADLVLDAATLEGGTKFEELRVGSLSVTGARFRGGVDMNSAVIGSDRVPTISGATFEDDVSFEGASLPKGGHFRDVRFCGGAYFSDVASEGLVTVFSGCEFLGSADFANASFGGQFLVEKCTLQDNQVSFDDATAGVSDFRDNTGSDLETAGIGDGMNRIPRTAPLDGAPATPGQGPVP